MEKHLGPQILARKIPSKGDVDKCLQAESHLLFRRTCQNVKDFCRRRIENLVKVGENKDGESKGQFITNFFYIFILFIMVFAIFLYFIKN